MTSKKVVSILFFFLLPTLALIGQDLNKKKLDSLFNILEKQKKIMGNLSIFRDGKEVYTHCTGYANVEKKLSTKHKTKYRIGSVSKMMTATVIMQLVEEGRLSYNNLLSEFFPGLPGGDHITILHLLQHKSGLRNILQDSTYRNWRTENVARDAMLTKIKSLGTTFQAGEKQEYSNTNYLLLTYIAEKIEKKPFSSILDTRISRPLKLKNTFFGTTINEGNNEAPSYYKKDNWIKADETHYSVALGAGSIVSTPANLNKFLTALFNKKILTDSTLKQMQVLQGEYGIGLKRLVVHGEELIGHSGGIDGFKAIAFYSPSKNMSFSIALNGAEISLSELLVAVVSISWGKEYDLPNFNSRNVHTSEELTSFTGSYEAKTSTLKTTVLLEHGNIVVKEGSQSNAIALDAVKKNKFRMGLSGPTFTFHPKEKTLLIDFGDGDETVLNKL